MAQSINLVDFLNTCQTGDLILVNARDHWYDRMIESFSYSKFSHIGMILRDPTYLQNGKTLKGLYFLESSLEKCDDAITHQRPWGVQIVPLHHVVAHYSNTSNGYLYYRKLTSQPRDTWFERTLRNSYAEVQGKPYDLLPWDWIKALFHIESGNNQRINTFWCSALIGFLYVRLKLLDPKLPWSLMAPRRFSWYENEQLTFYHGELLPEKWIQFDNNYKQELASMIPQSKSVQI